MVLIVKTLQIAGDRGKGEGEVLFDNGAASSLVKKSTAEKISTIMKVPWETKFKLGDGETTVKTNEVAVIGIIIDGKTIDDQFYVLEKPGKEIVVGRSTMQKWDMVLEPKEEKIIVRRDPQAIEFFQPATAVDPFHDGCYGRKHS